MLDKTELLLALNVGLLFLTMDRGRAALDAADRAGVELPVADLLNDAAPLHFAGEGIQKRLPRLTFLFACFYCHRGQYNRAREGLQAQSEFLER